MAKKAAKKVTATETTLKPVRVDLPPEIHRMLRLVSAHEGESMAKYAKDVITAHVKAEMKRRGIKP